MLGAYRKPSDKVKCSTFTPLTVYCHDGLAAVLFRRSLLLLCGNVTAVCNMRVVGSYIQAVVQIVFV